MYKRILIATDGSHASDKAIAQGLALAKSLGIPVVAVTSTEIWSALDMQGPDGRERIARFEAASAEQAQKTLAAVSTAANAAGVSCSVVHVADRSPAVAIVETAEREGCDLIVMGSHGRRGVDRILLGSEAQRVLTHARCPVLVCR